MWPQKLRLYRGSLYRLSSWPRLEDEVKDLQLSAPQWTENTHLSFSGLIWTLASNRKDVLSRFYVFIYLVKAKLHLIWSLQTCTRCQRWAGLPPGSDQSLQTELSCCCLLWRSERAASKTFLTADARIFPGSWRWPAENWDLRLLLPHPFGAPAAQTLMGRDGRRWPTPDKKHHWFPLLTVVSFYTSIQTHPHSVLH